MTHARVAALILDVDGTIADTEQMHRCAFNAAFASFGLDWHWNARLYGELLQVCGGKERLAAYLERRFASAEQRARLMDLVAPLHAVKTARYAELIARRNVRARAGIAALIGQARAAGVRLAIASTTSAQNIAPLLHVVLGEVAMNWFEVLATGDVVARKKPDPAIYRFALEALRVPAREAVAIEDSAIGVQAAKAAGVFTIGWPNRWTAGQDLRRADLVLPAMAPIPGLARLLAAHAAARPGALHAEMA